MATRIPPRLEELPDFVTVEEAALVLRRCEASTYTLARSGKIPSVRLGRRVVIPRTALERLVNGDGHEHAA